MVPASDAVFARLGRVDDFGVVFKTRADATLAGEEELVLAVITERKDREVPGTVDAGTDADAVGARAASEGFAVIKLWIWVVQAGQDAVAVEKGLVTCLRDLDLLVQAQVAEAREDAHDDSCCYICAAVLVGGRGNERSEVGWWEKKITGNATGYLACSGVSSRRER